MSGLIAALGDVADFINGAAFKPEDWVAEGARIIRIQNLTDASKPYNRTKRVVPERIQVQPGDLLVSWSATLGVFEWNQPDVAYVNQHIFRVVLDEKKVVKRYLRHALELALLDMRKHLHGATMLHVNRGEFLSTKFYLPELSEQRRIAIILDKADALRTKRREALAQLDRLAQSIFVEMFGDTLSNPKQLPFVEVGSIADVQGGLQVTSARKDLPIEVPYLRVANVYRGRLDLTEVKTIRATANEVTRTKLVPQDLLLVEGHGNPAEVGRAALWSGELAECVHQNHLIRVRFDHSKVSPAFACAYLNSLGGRQHLLRAGKTTSGLNTISVSNVRAAPLALPALAAQQAYEARVASVGQLKSVHRRASLKTEGLFEAVQHQAFQGQL